MKVKEMLIEYLKANGFDGLYCEDCGCQLSDLATCGGDLSNIMEC